MSMPGVSLASVSLGDARKIKFPNESSDVVLVMGPLYHLTEKDERLASLAEGLRVLKRDGVIFVAGISKFASALYGSRGGYIRDPDVMKLIQRDLRASQHRNPGNHPRYSTPAYF